MPAPRSLGRRLLRALVSAVVLAALTGGLPWLLWATTTAVWVPGTDAFAHLLSRPDTGAAFMLALCVIGWIAWASFAVSLLLEIPSQLRGRAAPRLPGLHLSQRAAGTLVSGIIVLFASSALASATPALATAGPATAVTASTAEVVPPASATAPEDRTAATAGTRQAAEQTYTVRDARPAESLWSIAEKVYGHGELYTKIADANEGRQMTDGTTFHADAPIQPGWILAVPEAPTAQAPAAPSQPSGGSYTVQGGDTLWNVAEEELGDGERYGELFEANMGSPTPDGGTFDNPDLIVPGQVLDLPKAATPGAPPPHRSAPKPDTPPSSPKASDRAEDAQHDTPPAPSSPAPGTEAVRPAQPTPPAVSSPSHTVQTPGSATPSPSTTATPMPAVQHSDEDSALGTVLYAAGGTLVAGGVVLMLRRRRILQRRRRADGQRIAMPSGPAAVAERALRSVDSSMELVFLDRVLRSFAFHVAAEDRPLPAVAAVQLGAEGVLLHLPAAAVAAGAEASLGSMAPFAAVKDQPGVWWCPADSAELLDDEALAGVASPYPALVPLGEDGTGGILLVDLDEFGALHLTGSRRIQMLRTLGISLALSPLGQVDVLVAGEDTAPGLSLLDSDRVQSHDDLASAAAAAHAHHADQQRLMADTGLPDLFHARVASDLAEEFHPLVVLSDLDTCPVLEAVDRIDGLLESEPLSSTAVITCGAQPARPAGGGIWEIDTDAPTLPVPDTSLQCVLSMCSDDDYADILTLAVTADSPTAVPAAAPVPLSKLFPDIAPDSDAGTSLQTTAPATGGAAPSLLASLAALDEDPEDAGEEEDEEEEEEAPEAAAETVTEPMESADPSAGAEDDDATMAANTVTVLPAAATPGQVVLPASRALPQVSIRLPAPLAEDPECQPPSESTPPSDGPIEAVFPDIDFPRDQPVINVLGPVEVSGARGTVDSNRRTRAMELAAFLVLHPGATAPQIDEVLSPRGGLTNPKTRNSRLRDVRRWLGLDDEDQPFFRRMAKHADGHRLVGVECDWIQFQLLHDVALQVPRVHGQALLRRALELVRGRPFSGVSSTYYSWAEPIVEDINDKIVNSASLLANWYLEAGDGRGALWAAGRGLEVAREREELWRHRFRALALLGDHTGLEEAIHRLEALLVDHGWAMDEETSQTIRMVHATRR
ncbi:LysM peptidoglycan-binding domain-containing protein [Streptomyces sp. NPDC088707]|uniref:LysM peptidoglycan-binding domain-containing protein n=1 Tax=Streptomyces sp. NPDC088707 TaxID=3365871 RepID=UPI00382AE2B9